MVKFVCLSVSLLGSLGRLVASSKSPSPTENIPTAPRLAFSKSHSLAFACLCYVFLFGPWGLTPAGGQVLEHILLLLQAEEELSSVLEALWWTVLKAGRHWLWEAQKQAVRGCRRVPLQIRQREESQQARQRNCSSGVWSFVSLAGGGDRCASGQGRRPRQFPRQKYCGMTDKLDDVVVASMAADDDKTCGICLEDSKDPLNLPCGHSFCDGCLGEWRSRYGVEEEMRRKCPICRAKIPPSKEMVSMLLSYRVQKQKMEDDNTELFCHMPTT